jgi:hypothetical protein
MGSSLLNILVGKLLLFGWKVCTEACYGVF